MTDSPPPPSTFPARFRVGSVLVDSAANEVQQGEVVQRLESRTLAVLVYLAQRAGDVARREELMAEVWRGRIVTDDSLTRAIAQLRQALNDSTAIETLPKVGYRLKWPVSVVPIAQPEPSSSSLQSSPSPPSFTSDGEAMIRPAPTHRPSHGLIWLLLALTAIAAVLTYLFLPRQAADATPALQPLVIQSVTPKNAHAIAISGSSTCRPGPHVKSRVAPQSSSMPTGRSMAPR